VTEADARIEGIRALWRAGDYAQVAARFRAVTDEVVAELDLAGRRVLDAATGTGNAAIAAARAGADVDAFDLTPELLDQARRRAAEVGVTVRFVEGDLLDLPYPDGTFDVVLSTFGAFLADDPATCARELVRVCRPGGSVVTTAWATEGMFGAGARVLAELHPASQDDDRAQAYAWAEPGYVARLVADLPVDVRLERRTVWFAFPGTAAAFDHLEEVSGPYQAMRRAIEDTGGSWEAFRLGVVADWDRLAVASGDGVELPAVYGLITLRRDA